MTTTDTKTADHPEVPAADDPGWVLYGEGWAPSHGSSADFEFDASERIRSTRPSGGDSR